MQLKTWYAVSMDYIERFLLSCFVKIGILFLGNGLEVSLLVSIYISPCIKTGIHVNNLKTTGENDSKHLKIFCNQYQNRLHRVSTSRAYKLSTLLTLESIFFKSSLEKKFLVTFRYCWTGNWVLMSSSKKNL